MLMGGKFVDEFSFKVVVYQRTLVQKVRITQKFVVKYEDFNMEQLTALVVLMQLIFHLMLTSYVDGISITHGTNPCNHIFMYASGCSESGSCWLSSLFRMPLSKRCYLCVPKFPWIQ